MFIHIYLTYEFLIFTFHDAKTLQHLKSSYYIPNGFFSLMTILSKLYIGIVYLYPFSNEMLNVIGLLNQFFLVPEKNYLSIQILWILWH